MIAFHRFLIAMAILFCLVIGGWMLSEFRGQGGTPLLILAVCFGVAAVALAYYLRHLNRFLGRR